NATLAIDRYPLLQGLGLAFTCLICIVALYLFNDIVDARDDQHNPKKDQRLAALYVQYRVLFAVVWFAFAILTLLGGALLDPRAAFWIAAVSLLNGGYSLVSKRIPLVDVLSVGLWGAAYAAIVTDATACIVMIGAMTAICHIYQASEDREAD